MFLVDEAQMAYKQPDVDAAIWGYCKLLGLGQAAAGQTGKIRFVLAAAYGAHCSGRHFTSKVSPASTPLSPIAAMVVTVQQRADAACLALSPTEFEELWESFVRHFNIFFQSDLIKNLVYGCTGAQVVCLSGFISVERACGLSL